MAISDHKKEESLKSYSSKVTKAKKREMSESLSNAIESQKAIKQIEECNSVAMPANNKNQNEGQNSIRDLLQLSAEEEENFLKEIFKDDDDTFGPLTQVVNNNNNNVQAISSPKIGPYCLPKMVFQNSNVTINFNVGK